MGKDVAVALKNHHLFRGELLNFWGCKCILLSEATPIITMQQKMVHMSVERLHCRQHWRMRTERIYNIYMYCVMCPEKFCVSLE